MTLILISHKFSITAVTVSIISSNSDFSYIQRGVTKAAGHVAKCGKAVAQWLASLGLVTEVREVLAFPNLRQSMMQRITRDKVRPIGCDVNEYRIRIAFTVGRFLSYNLLCYVLLPRFHIGLVSILLFMC